MQGRKSQGSDKAWLGGDHWVHGHPLSPFLGSQLATFPSLLEVRFGQMMALEPVGCDECHFQAWPRKPPIPAPPCSSPSCVWDDLGGPVLTMADPSSAWAPCPSHQPGNKPPRSYHERKKINFHCVRSLHSGSNG